MQIRALFFLVFATALSACGSLAPTKENSTNNSQKNGIEIVRQFLSTPMPLAPYQVGRAYEVAGIAYKPRENFDYDETGLASFYVNSLEGALTSSGEAYSKSQFTAAHATLPFQTIVQVTHLDSGASAIVRINDRGPFISGRLIDVSEAAARQLGIIQEGASLVRVEVLEQETQIFRAALNNGRLIPFSETGEVALSDDRPTQPPEDDPTLLIPEPSVENQPPSIPDPLMAEIAHLVRVGSYDSLAEAQGIKDKMADLGTTFIEAADGKFKVYIGPFASHNEAQVALASAFGRGATDAGYIRR